MEYNITASSTKSACTTELCRRPRFISSIIWGGKEYMKKVANNYAFIDSQNLNLGIQKLGWKLDYRKFRIYLAEKYGVTKAHLFIGFVALNQSLYDNLQEAGFILKFKPTIPDANGKIKGNIDADLVLRVVLELNEYDKAVIDNNRF